MVTTPTPYDALMAAVEAAGSLSALARIAGISPQAVWKWVNVAKRVPAEFVLRIEAATGVSRHHIRPDIYPMERRRRVTKPSASPMASKHKDALHRLNAGVR